ncbi:zinc finger protein 624-like isoform X2 [Wyeomyia smithii]|nr:zinc finger protein 624-like isoform X2 [Wyeomyia smithii]
MASIADILGENSIAASVAEALNITLRDEDFLPLICMQCLARVEILLAIRTMFLKAEREFTALIEIAQTSALEIHNNFTLEHPPVDAFIEEELTMLDSKSDTEQNLKSQAHELAMTFLGSPLKKEKDQGKKCYICMTVFPNTSVLLSHLTKLHATRNGYRCNECMLDFSHVIALNRHLSWHQWSERANKCSICAAKFSSVLHVKVHEYKAHGIANSRKVNKSWPTVNPCNVCSKVFKCPSKLNQHIKVKHEHYKAPTCDICDRTFTATSSLERHMLVHTNEKPYNCDKCDACFRRVLELRNHITMVHEGINPHVCQECRASFKNYHALYIHRQTVHRNKPAPVVQFKPYHLTCKLCKRQHNKSNELIDHIREDHTEEVYPYVQCPDCPRTFLSQQHLSHHKEVHTDKYACSYCGLRNPTIQRLQNHVENKHSEVRKYDCRVCINKSYKTKAALRKHVLMHTHGKQFQCDICQKTFMRKDQMVIHRRIHTGEKPFQCETCLKRFSDDATFSKHKKRCWPLPVSIDEDLNSLFLEY